jgi:membrane protease YdiL (CAAX protease family)
VSNNAGNAYAPSVVEPSSVTAYFILTFAISWTGALLVVAPALVRGQPVPLLASLLMFPAMLLGPPLASIILTFCSGGRSALRDLGSRMGKLRVQPAWYLCLLIPPILVTAVLFSLKTLVSPMYAPNRFLMGIGFGVVAGFLEEIGWMGFAFPRMAVRHGELRAAIILGLLWGLWHLPAIDHLGAASPHGRYWFLYFLAFTFAMTAMRVLIAWLYTNTSSVFLAQAMHAFSTSSLVVFSPATVTPAQEVFWYCVYGFVLWLVVAAVVATNGARLRLQRFDRIV